MGQVGMRVGGGAHPVESELYTTAMKELWKVSSVNQEPVNLTACSFSERRRSQGGILLLKRLRED